jgi:hypothetical protein
VTRKTSTTDDDTGEPEIHPWEEITSRQQAIERLVRDGHVEAVTAVRCLGEARTLATQFSEGDIWLRVICEIVDPLIAALECSTPGSSTS